MFCCLYCIGQEERIDVFFVSTGDTIKNPNYYLKINDTIIFNQEKELTLQALVDLTNYIDKIVINISIEDYTLIFTDVFLSGLIFIPKDNIWYFTIYDANITSECFGNNFCASFLSKWGNAEYFYVY